MLRPALASALSLARRHSSALALLLLWSAAYAVDRGQWNGVSPQIREWFKSVRNPQGTPCCDIADGHPATWRSDNNGGYEVLIDGEWLSVPPETIVRKYGNPTGEFIVWYSPAGVMGELPRVRCFVVGVEG